MSDPAPFKDHFSGQARAYGQHRPGYPPAYFAWLAGIAPDRQLAVDVATGNGQAAAGLAAHFDRVIATELSAAQLAEARAQPRVEYRREPAEAISVPAGSVDLLACAQAAHWLDWPRFTAEAARVLRPGGILAYWCYGNCRVTPAIDRLLADFSRDVVGPYWPRERRHVDEGYRDLVATLPPVEVPEFELCARWDAAEMLGYLGTWSAVRRCEARSSRDPLRLLAHALGRAWGAAERDVRWPLSVKVHRA